MPITPQELTKLYQERSGTTSTPQNDFKSRLLQRAAEKQAQIDALKPEPEKEKSLLRKGVDFFTDSAQKFGDTLGQSIVAPKIAEEIKQGEANQARMSQELRQKLADKPAEERKEVLLRLRNIESSAPTQISEKGGLTEIAPATEKSAKQVFGEGAGTLAETLSFGAFGGLSKAAQSGKLLTGSTGILNKANKLGLPAVGLSQGVKQSAKQKALQLGGEGALLGGLFGGAEAAKNDQSGGDIAKGILSGSLLGGAIGGALPVLGGAGSVLAKKSQGAGNRYSERIINSLIKPLKKDLAYGKNPARGVINEGIVFNSLEEGANKVSQRKTEIGQSINQVLSSPENMARKVDISSAVQPIDDAILNAKKTPRTNSALIKRLEDAKADILAIDEATGQATRKLVDITPQEAVDIKRLIGEITKFTGNQSDDGLVNKALKQSYGKIKGAVNDAVPGIAELNERYADLISAEIAMRYRDKIAGRQNVFSLPQKLGTIGGFLAGGATLNPVAIITTFAGVGVDKALGTPAFKSRFAQWLSKAPRTEILEVTKKAPEVAPIIDTVIKNLGVRLEPSLIKAEIEKIVPSVQ